MRGVGEGGAACGVGSMNVNDSVKSYIKVTEIRSMVIEEPPLY